LKPNEVWLLLEFNMIFALLFLSQNAFQRMPFFREVYKGIMTYVIILVGTTGHT
jgi:hypothetical protein